VAEGRRPAEGRRAADARRGGEVRRGGEARRGVGAEPEANWRDSRNDRANGARELRLDQPRVRRGPKLPRFDPEAFGRWSEGIARFMGTAKFLVYMTVVIVAWIGWNALAPRAMQFDPYTFTFLTLILSLQASYAAPLILLAQNRQADRDRLASEEDRRRAAMQKADTEYLTREIAALRIALGEVATRDFLRSELTRVLEELDESAHRQAKLARKELQRQQRKAARRAEAAAFDEAEAYDDADAVEDDPEESPEEGDKTDNEPRASRGKTRDS
jgi:uncharacterized membrane protein